MVCSNGWNALNGELKGGVKGHAVFMYIYIFNSFYCN